MNRYFFVFLFGLIGCNSPSVSDSELTFDSFEDKLEFLEDKNNFSSSQERVNFLFDVYGDYCKTVNPFQATLLGFKGYQGEWFDFSQQGREERIQRLSRLNQVAASMGTDGLGKDQVFFDVLEESVSKNLGYLQHNADFSGAINHITGNQLFFPQGINLLPGKTDEDLKVILGYLQATGPAIDSLISFLRIGMQQNLVLTKISVDKTLVQVSGLIHEDPQSSPFFLPFKEVTDTQQEFQESAKIIIDRHVTPAFQRLQDFIIKEYGPASTTEIAESARPDGADRYAFLTGYHSSSTFTPSQVHDIGLKEVERIKAEMENVKSEVGFTGTLGAFHSFLQNDSRFGFKSADELLTYYRSVCKRIDPLLPALFANLPRLTYGVEPVPAYQGPSMPAAYYNPGSLQKGVPGIFFANTYAYEKRPKWEVMALALHEAVPGHHFQVSLAAENPEAPDFMKFMMTAAFAEGWGLYAESLGYEMHLYDDPYVKFGQLTYEMWRAIRLVIDTGIHFKGWSREESINFFENNSAKSRLDIEVEVDRYIAMPGQALAYKIGELKIQELRRTAEDSLGERFDLRIFHDILLKNGSLPLSVLQGVVNDWIASVSGESRP